MIIGGNSAMIAAVLLMNWDGCEPSRDMSWAECCHWDLFLKTKQCFQICRSNLFVLQKLRVKNLILKKSVLQ